MTNDQRIDRFSAVTDQSGVWYVCDNRTLAVSLCADEQQAKRRATALNEARATSLFDAADDVQASDCKGLP